ncbi:mesenchyme-specific cell surface glycoprotein-like [Haliotis rufescens]|uniref:mesenchyme-specific cell surface glycoprotein-like n=1 Tax=Haliotis rufescens TaxID=6454 RepID=UPI001EB04D88|nr:mesenchyme-specific cell surface glycoprotein-like [Haliotis rufescens]XP_048252940.1 mesenchyme-specific cell surface glycoprotein-like [Haliotis rufescens]
MHVCLVGMVALVGVAYGVVVLKEASYLRLPDRNGQYVVDSRTARESAYDDVRSYLYVVGRDTAMLHVISLADPANPQEVYAYNFDIAADGRPLDVELCRAAGVTPTLAVTFDGQDSVAYEGHLVLYNLFESSSDTLTPLNPTDPRIIVGAHPDNMKFTSDCRRLVVSNEGEPRVVDGTFFDPEGTVSVLTFSPTPGAIPTVATIDFRKFDDQSELVPILDRGVRYWLRRDPTDASNIIQFSQNVEPEYVAISPSNGFAYITLQENNAIARIDLENSVITSLYPMGNKSWEFLSLDASDSDNGIAMASRRIRSLYQPDKVAFFTWGDDIPYLLTIDEGKPTTIPGVNFQDYARAASLNWNIDDAALGSELTNNAELGRLYVSNVDGFDNTPNVPYAFGGRGFSIWNTQSMERTWESGDELERYSRQHFPNTYNGNCAAFLETPVQEMDARSPWMGPEPNSVAIGDFNGRTVLVIGSGRNGMLYVYTLQPNVNTPTPEFQSVHRAGEIDATWTNLYTREDMGDAIISDIKFSSTGTPKVIVTSEASGSVSVYTLADETWPATKL